MKKLFSLSLLINFCTLSFVSADRPSYEAQVGIISSGGFVVFYNSRGPLSYSTLTQRDLPQDAVDAGEVKCKSCQHGVSIPVTAPSSTGRSTNISGVQGDGSFRKALMNLYRERPELRGVYDVKIDMHRISVLGFYRRLCTEISARGFR